MYISSTDYLGTVGRPCLFDLYAEGSFVLLGLPLRSSRVTMRRRGRSHVASTAVFFRGDDYAVPRGLRGIEDGEQGDVVHATLLEVEATVEEHDGLDDGGEAEAEAVEGDDVPPAGHALAHTFGLEVCLPM